MSRVICITGASSGIGLATALLFAAEGWTVYAGTRNIERDQQKYIHRNLNFVNIDVTKQDTIERAIQTIDQYHGRLDLLFCNAGFGYVKALNQTEIKDVQEVFDTNVYGVIRTIREAFPLMRKAGGGHIVATSSISGLVGQALNEVYCASKFALEGLIESLATYYKPYFNIDVTLIEPGAINTNFSNTVMSQIAANGGIPEDEFKPVFDAFISTFGSVNADPQSPESVAKVVLELTRLEEKPLRIRTSDEAERFVSYKVENDPNGLSCLYETRNIQLGL
ncbi:NADP-dependent 3-hydroxy acid dehydrogenase YdfG [Paenibacillus sophorae]|uniref:NADP-dependent 3-hydroxy acid dehydrogenase YdfG n=1 Tax=Paenibacillus sophorae TaxID=1333845 RepID=A0A1H8W082_9BACL|nr:SDR family oxidoreductase [Paenibacillus sophorae]QWU15462.1 SDR family oxidoreductase [Paenibacillus sophorae]SEP21072.1 NADP-dependent 3-hydroxy acid dehydrogenase YdfG [Paenibacillus sophorae]